MNAPTEPEKEWKILRPTGQPAIQCSSLFSLEGMSKAHGSEPLCYFSAKKYPGLGIREWDSGGTL